MIELEGRTFGPGNPMFVAEISCNHMGEYELAEALVHAAKETGADAVKFQAFEPWHMAPENGPRLSSGPWQGRTLFELYQEAQTPTAWLKPLFELARSLDLIPFASVFHPDMVPVLEELEPACYKIASAEAGWRELIEAADATGKQLIISDGGVVELYTLGGFDSIPVILRCVPEYPAHCSGYSFEDIAYETAPWGLSDHSMAPVTWITAAALGASVIEAHLMLPDTKPLDYRHSLLPLIFKGHIRVAKQAAEMAYGDPPKREPIEFARRMLWARDMDAGDVVSLDDMVCLRAPAGLQPNEAEAAVGRTMKRRIAKGTPVLDNTVTWA